MEEEYDDPCYFCNDEGTVFDENTGDEKICTACSTFEDEMGELRRFFEIHDKRGFIVSMHRGL